MDREASSPRPAEASEAADAAGDDVLKADRGLRNRLLFFLIVFSAAGAAVIFGFERYLEQVMASAEDHPEQAIREVFQLLQLSSLMGGAGLVVFGLYYGRFSMKVVSTGRFPPPGTKVIRDTRVQTGKAASLRGWAGIAVSGALILLGFAVPWVPDLVIRPMIQAAEQGEQTGEGPMEDAIGPAPFDPEMQARLEVDRLADFQADFPGSLEANSLAAFPGRSETGPGPRAFSFASTFL
jgi:hypothetical protein